MIPSHGFIDLVRVAIPRFQRYPPNARQETCILHPAAVPLVIVAGPGSGKTTVLVLRALQLVFVGDMLPENIVITTFTKKAANEIRARLIEWGLLLLEYIRYHPPVPAPIGFSSWLDNIDVNRFVTGTLDSICEEAVTRYRDPMAAAPVVIEGFVANAELMLRGLFPAGAHPNPRLDDYLSPFTFDGGPPSNFGEKLKVCRTILDRLSHDEVNLTSFRLASSHPVARACVADTAALYWNALVTNNRLDFARLETVFLERLRNGLLGRFVESVNALLIDEYQDTNPLQESIYFELMRQTGSSLTLVGDDDQSLYRFRGATIELFRDFRARFQAELPEIAAPRMEYLVENYRSTPEIVEFFNEFIENDPAFTPARVHPPKPRIIAQRPSVGVPILGMFRPDVASLARDLTDFLLDVFRGGGRQIPVRGGMVNVRAFQPGGDFGDSVLLAHTVNEFARAWGSNPPRERLPHLLRNRLAARGVWVFNPRGRALRDIPEVQQLLGTILLCIDPPSAAYPEGAVFASMRGGNQLRGEAIRYLTAWRLTGQAFVGTNPPPNAPRRLGDFIRAWQSRTPQGGMPNWPDEWPLLELCFKLISWFPLFRDDPEGQVYIEAISRVISQAATFSSYRSNLVFHNPIHEPMSVRKAISDILVPLAENDVEVDEDIMPSVPRDRFCLMTIHQAKGLEYPLIIVDVASDYSRDHPMQRFRRFPENPSNVANLEDDLAPYCAIGPLRVARSPLARTFDDLIRLYYVAYSRPQSVLLFVGLNPCLRYSTNVRHVATGWRFGGSWAWRNPVSGRPPALANNIPLTLI